MNKKKLFSMILAVVAVVSLSAQENTFSKGDKVVNVSIGLGSSIYGSGFTGGIPPIGLSLEYGIKDNLFDDKSSLGIGAYGGFTTADFGMGTYTSILVGARGLLHYQLVEKLDTYAGLMLGYNIASVKYSSAYVGIGGVSTGGLIYAGFIGARYYFTPKFAALAELGYGIAVLNLGVSFKL